MNPNSHDIEQDRIASKILIIKDWLQSWIVCCFSYSNWWGLNGEFYMTMRNKFNLVWLIWFWSKMLVLVVLNWNECGMLGRKWKHFWGNNKNSLGDRHVAVLTAKCPGDMGVPWWDHDGCLVANMRCVVRMWKAIVKIFKTTKKSQHSQFPSTTQKHHFLQQHENKSQFTIQFAGYISWFHFTSINKIFQRAHSSLK